VRREAYAKCQDARVASGPVGYLFVDTLIAAKSKTLKGIYPCPTAGFPWSRRS